MKLESYNITDEGVERLTSMFADSKNLQALVKMFLEELQEVEDALATLANSKDIDNISGVWLDYVGMIINEPRKGREDKDYKPALKLRIAISTANGTHSDVTEIVKVYTKSSKIVLAQGILSWGNLIFDGKEGLDGTLIELVQAIIPVTTSVVVMNNTNGTCFFPAWETGINQPNRRFDTDTIGNFKLAWEGAVNLDTHEDIEYKLQVEIGKPLEPLQLKGISEDTQGTLMPWEIVK